MSAAETLSIREDLVSIWTLCRFGDAKAGDRRIPGCASTRTGGQADYFADVAGDAAARVAGGATLF